MKESYRSYVEQQLLLTWSFHNLEEMFQKEDCRTGTRTRWTIHKYTTRWIDTNQFIQFYQKTIDEMILHLTGLTHRNVSKVIPLLLEFLVSVNLIHQYPNNRHRVFHLHKATIKRTTRINSFVPACNIEILLSDSGGRISTNAFECLCNATLAPALSNSRSMVERMRT